MVNAQNKKSDFFDHKNISAYKVEVTPDQNFKDSQSIYKLNVEDTLELIGVLKGYNWNEDAVFRVAEIGWQMYFFYERLYPIRITRPDGKVTAFLFQNDFPNSPLNTTPETSISFDESANQRFKKEDTELIKGYFRKYISNFKNVDLLQGELIKILQGPANGDGSPQKLLANMTQGETLRYLKLFNTGWDLSHQYGGNPSIIRDTRPYILMYGGKELFPQSSAHHAHGYEFTPEVSKEMDDIIKQAISRNNK